MDEAHLTSEEARDLVYTIIDAVESIENGAPVRNDLANEMRDWALLLLDRLDKGGDA